ncbi:PREDICTED: tudor domain-containing protein 15 [Cyprinodon variegatus]|uniref:tudor domain-containing protein 15 n=1 Tax=Cyprinodon variegatus TaxID=28743 RepID=UPI000742922A|nr:PREDICTED: tudor domain-containing protein 15 [Cyprinodon variegatus]
MQTREGPEHLKFQDSGELTQHPLWSVDLKLNHLDWSPEATLIHFQGQYPSTCDLDYNILQQELQNVPKTKAAVEVAGFCLVEDVTSAQWYRGRVQNRKGGLHDVFLIDYGNVLSVDVAHISSCSDDLFILPPKIVSGFLANVLIFQNSSQSLIERYFSTLIGKNVTGFIQALLPYKILLLEAPDINYDLVQHGFGRHVDRDTFLLLVSMLTEGTLKENVEPVPDLLIEKSRGQEFCYKSSSFHGFQDILSICGPKLSIGKRAKVKVTAAVSPRLFYCLMADAAPEFLQVSKKLAEICEDKMKRHSWKTTDNLGNLCAVKGKDQRWYRGIVQFLLADSLVRVFFIDYGFFEMVKIENVQSLPPEFFSKQIMAFPCTLSPLADQETAFRTQQLSFLKAGLLGAVLNVEIIGFAKANHLYTIRVLSDGDAHVEEPERFQNLCSRSVSNVEDTTPQHRHENYKAILCEALCQTLEAEEVQVGSDFFGYVEYAKDPNHFWIRTEKRNQEFEEMITKINEHFTPVKLEEDVLLNPEVGTMCCALYEEDMHFYRGMVIDVIKHGAEILFIDFGNVEKVPHNLIKKIPRQFTSTPPFAICSTLVSVFPLDDVWPSTTCQFFRRAVSNKALLINLKEIKNNLVVVDLFERGSSISIAELLSSSKLAEHIPQKPADKSNKELSHYEANRATKMGKWQSCDEGVNKTEEVKANSMFKALKIKPGFELSVHCSHITSPSDFWCQPLDGIPALKELMKEIQLYYSAHTAPLQPNESCCVAKSLQDGRWYRGYIIRNEKSHTLVMLVDYGSVIQVRSHDLQAIMPEYLHLEGQAFRCSLSTLIEPADPKNCSDWSPHACTLLKSFACNARGILKCRVISQLNMKKVGLCNVVSLQNSKTQEDFAKTLTELGLARVASSSKRQNSDVLPETFTYSSFELSPGAEELVYVTHVSSHYEVYCHLERNSEVIEELAVNISQESENIMQASTGPVVTRLCLAKYLDGKWYRGMMLPTPSSLHVGVFFVDYGNTNISDKKSILLIPRSCEELLYTPMQAVKFNLYSVPTTELYVDIQEWLSKALINKLVKAVLQGKRNDGSFDVELFDGDISINEKVKELILSSQKPNAAATCRVSSTKTKKNHNLNKGKCQSKSAMQRQGSSPSKVLNGAKMRNTQKPAHGRSPNRNSGAKQTNEHNTRKTGPIKPQTRSTNGSQKSQPTRQRNEGRKSQPAQLLDKHINPGFKAKCFVSHIDSTSSFFLQLSDDELAIFKMGEYLNFSVLKNSLKTASRLSIGDVALSEFEEDGALYRSVVKNQEDISHYSVEFVDYGNSAVVEKEHIYQIPEEFLSQPRFSIPCSLMNTATYRDETSFAKAVLENPLMVEFVCQQGIQWQVKVGVLNGEAQVDSTHGCVSETKRKEESPSPLSESIKNSSVEQCREVGSVIKSKSSVPEQSAKQQAQNNGKSSMSLSVTRDQPDAVLPQTNQIKNNETGTILSLQRNCSFYVRLTKDHKVLTSMEMHLIDNIKEYKIVPEADIRQGLKCLVQAGDGKWWRAVILHIRKIRLEVFLVDHGVTADIKRGPVRQQCTYLENIPNLARLCRIKSPVLVEGETVHQGWYEGLQRLVGTKVRLVSLSFSEADEVWLVEKVLSSHSIVSQVKALMQQKGENVAASAATQIESLPNGLGVDGWTPQLISCAPLETDKAYLGSVAAVNTPSQFSVMLYDFLPIMDKVSILLDNLPENIPTLPQADLVPGACCLLLSGSEMWCRAEIKQIETILTLNLVDYGHNVSIPYDEFSKLKRLPQELADLPKTTYPCVLRGVKSASLDGQWSDEAAAFFQLCLVEKNMQIFFRELGTNSTWAVDILADGVYVAEELVAAGHANNIDVLLEHRLHMSSVSKHLQVCDADQQEASSEVCCGAKVS